MFRGNKGYNGRKSQKIGKSLSMLGLHWLHLQELMMDLLFLKTPHSQRLCCLHGGGRAQALLPPAVKGPEHPGEVGDGRSETRWGTLSRGKQELGGKDKQAVLSRVHLMGSHSQIWTAAEGGAGVRVGGAVGHLVKVLRGTNLQI